MSSFETARPTASEECTLKQLTDQLIIACQPAAQKQNSYFINNVPAGLKIGIDKEGLATLLGSMFYIMASCSRDTCIKISAENYHDMVMLRVKDSSTFNSYAVGSKRQHLQQLAEKIGGSLTITSEQPKETTITFSFNNLQAWKSVWNEHLESGFSNGLAYA
ncbi:MAG: hypothetical protein JWM28_1516 [Chitinophagaceae bacterium]|nr:hypothetical protein [Chitinophagaceae bacterium]